VEALEVLRCNKCDAPLALADAATVTCPSCSTVNDIPTTYRDLHRARIANAAARDQAEHVLRKLDTPASVVTKVLARTFDQNMFVFLLFFGVPVMLWSVLLALRADDWIAVHFHYRSGDDVPFGYTAVFLLGSLFVFVFVPRVLGVYANRRVADRGRLLAALAARPPTVPGAASQCRMCGAPLAVEPDKILAICSYCRAENAVHLETKLVTDTGAGTVTIGREASTALTRDREERRATRHLLAHELGRYVLRTVLIGGAFVLGCQEDANRQPTTLSIIGLVAALGLFVFFLIRSMMTPDEDAHERRAGNDIPGWVGVVGPIVVLIVAAKAC
jgi:phage FluMu protein Com